MSSQVGGGWMNPRLTKRVGLTLVVFFFSAAFIMALLRFTPGTNIHLPDMRKVVSLPDSYMSGSERIEPVCTFDGTDVSPLTALDAKYAHLRDDKFTIAMQTYRRPKELKDTLTALAAEDIPSLHEIVIVWNDLEDTPPEDYVTEFGVPVRYRRSERNSLNEKLIPDTSFETKAILLTDDDVYYKPGDLEFVFQAWRKFGQYRLVGALARCSKLKDGKWEYTFCSDHHDDDGYELVLTNLCFSHIAFMDYYSSDATEAVKTREYVDEHFNCEDIALNYVASKLTGWGPLEVTGHDRYVNMDPSVGISRKPGHLEARSQCLNDLEEIYGCMPLVEETSRIQRGVQVL